MARYQYRLAGSFDVASSVGNALLALENLGSSGKRVTIRSVDVYWEQTRSSSDVNRQFVAAGRGAGVGGAPIVAARHDQAAAPPAGLVVRAGGTFDIAEPISQTSSAIGLAASDSRAFGITANTEPGGRTRGWWRGQMGVGAQIQPHVLNAGESFGIAIYLPGIFHQPPLSASVTVRADGATFTYSSVAYPMGVGEAVIWVENGSSGVVEVLAFGVQPLGALAVTPYLQVVPYSGVPLETLDIERAGIVCEPTDSAYPAASTWVRALSNTPLNPSGAPVQYASNSGSGAPKSANYLQTKDFLGPVYRTLFPEVSTIWGQVTGNAPDDRGFARSMKFGSELGIRRGGGIVLRPGEGLAVVPAAETFGTGAAVIAGAITVFVSFVFDIENEVQPYLTLTGLQPGSDIVVLEAGTGNFLQQIDAYSGTSWVWPYDSDVVTSVDVCIYKPGFVPLSLRNLTTPPAGLSIPIAQAADRNYI